MRIIIHTEYGITSNEDLGVCIGCIKAILMEKTERNALLFYFYRFER